MSNWYSPEGKAFFLDTNIVVYCFDSSAGRKQDKAKDLVAHAASSGLGVVSTQVMQEFCNVASNSRRLNLENERSMAYLKLVLAPMCRVSTSTELLEVALNIRAEYKYAFYDSLILAAAQEAKCGTIYSEDMQHTQAIGNLQIVNPFLDAVHEP